MKRIILVLLLVAFLVLPAHSFDLDEADVWPCFFGTDAGGGLDNGYISYYDQDTNAFQAPRLIANDLLAFQWTPQRNAVGYKADGTSNVSFVEAVSNDLEIWESPDDAWQDDAGAWGLLDDDASEDWLAVDVETRQNYIWADAIVITTPRTFFIDVSAGVPAWTALGIIPASDTTTAFSICLDQMLIGGIHFIGIDNSDGFAKYFNITPAVYTGALDWENTIGAGSEGFPQIISGGYNELYAFYTGSNILLMTPNKIGGPPGTSWTTLEDEESVYTATELTADYHVTWQAMDDTIHVVLVDFDAINPNSTFLIYLRRTPNGWSAPVTLLTVDSDPGGADDNLVWPQITVDPIGSIFIHYILIDSTLNPGGDLQGFHLDFTDYDDFATPATWTQYVNIDQSADLVIWEVCSDSTPIASDI